MIETQNKQILNHLKDGYTITPIEALKLYGCFRLSGRIYDLKQMGYNIKKVTINDGEKKFAKYYLDSKTQHQIDYV